MLNVVNSENWFISGQIVMTLSLKLWGRDVL